jgi:hypothetical protein
VQLDRRAGEGPDDGTCVARIGKQAQPRQDVTDLCTLIESSNATATV